MDLILALLHFFGINELEESKPQVETKEAVVQKHHHYAGFDKFDKLADCESGRDPKALNPSGRYRGAFQFDLKTWRATGRSGDPIDYSYAEQRAAAKDLFSLRGGSPWPYCSIVAGLDGN